MWKDRRHNCLRAPSKRLHRLRALANCGGVELLLTFRICGGTQGSCVLSESTSGANAVERSQRFIAGDSLRLAGIPCFFSTIVPHIFNMKVVAPRQDSLKLPVSIRHLK